MSIFRKAERRKAKLRLALCSPSGYGKTLTALLIAYGITGDWSKIAVIDTERGSADLYIGTKIPGTDEKIGQYMVHTMEPPFSPQAYCEIIWAGEKENFEVLIIDSTSHAWEGKGGVLEIHDNVTASSNSKNSYMAWRDVTPQHNRLVDAILSSPMHIISTMRTKVAYDLEDDGYGKKKPVKVGMKPIQREGMEYEFTVVLDLSAEHVATASKDRTQLFDGRPHVPTVDTGKRLREWLEDGVDPLAAARNALADADTDLEAKAVAAEFKAQAKREGWVNELLAMFEERKHEIAAASDYGVSSASVASPQDAAAQDQEVA